MKYRKKPVVIDAVQWTGSSKSWEEVCASLEVPKYGCADEETAMKCVDRMPVIIHTLEGDLRAELGDWIIKGVKGEFYPCKDDIFRATYEPAEG